MRLTDLVCGVRDITWSPDGTRIAFTTLVDPKQGLQPLAAAVAPDDLYERFNRDVLRVGRVRWKSDGLGYIGDHFRQLALVAYAPDATTMPQPVLLTSGAWDLGAPAWSPDGRMLATTGNLEDGGEWLRRSIIYLVDTEAVAPVAPVELFALEEMRNSDLTWSPDGATIAVCGHNDPTIGHYGNQMLWLIDVASGTGRCVSDHIDRAFGDYSRNGDMRRYGGDDGPRWHPDGTSLLLLNNEAGAVHLCRFSIEDGSLTPLSTGDCCTMAFSTDARQQTVVALVGDSINSGDLFVIDDTASDPRTMHQLTDVNAEVMATVQMDAPIRFRCPSADGAVEIDGWIHAPIDREPGVRYPVILYTGGGPGGMRASVLCHEFHLYAASGYVVINCNTRGNHGYGQAFSTAIRGHWGDLDYEDNIAFLHAVCAEFDFVDAERTIVAGGSYGGYSATWIIERHPEFKAAVVDRSLVNRLTADASDMGFLLSRVEFNKKTMWEDTETYLHRSPIMHITSVKTPTMVVHSALDHRCPIDQGEQLYMSLKRIGVPTELVRFPNESHELSRAGQPWHRVYRLDRYLEWFGRWV